VDQIPVSLRVVMQAFSDWWDDWVNMVVINLVWALCWLTIVLGPPATFGLYHVTNRLVEGQAVELRGMLEVSGAIFSRAGHGCCSTWSPPS